MHSYLQGLVKYTREDIWQNSDCKGTRGDNEYNLENAILPGRKQARFCSAAGY